MLTSLFLPAALALAGEPMVQPEGADHLDVLVRSQQSTAQCPRCLQPASRRHSTYVRALADLPIAGHPVRLRLQVRKFFCDHPACVQRIFTERLPTVVLPFARRTRRLAQQQTQLGLALGGRPAARLSQQLGLPVSRDTLVRLIRRVPLPALPTPRVLAIDDWAKRKGQSYGSILVDLEQHRVVDLLPDRTAETFRDWLQSHPGVEVICRDRATTYAEGAALGAPLAQQVADRFHLVHNLAEALRATLRKHERAILQAVNGSSPPPLVTAASVSAQLARQHLEQEQRYQERSAQLASMQHLHAQGMTMKRIAAQFGIHPKTVRRWFRAETVPDRRGGRRRPTRLAPHLPYLIERWNAGCHNAVQLCRELTARGYRGKLTMVRVYCAQLRKAQGFAPKHRTVTSDHAPITMPARPWRLGDVVGWIMRPQERLTRAEQQGLARVPGVHSEVDQAIRIAQHFTALVRERKAGELDAWIATTRASGMRPLVRLAEGIHRDRAAVGAGMSEPWSTGQAEGQINRLKLLKRQMFGKAKLDLLKQRLLAT